MPTTSSAAGSPPACQGSGVLGSRSTKAASSSVPPAPCPPSCWRGRRRRHPSRRRRAVPRGSPASSRRDRHTSCLRRSTPASRARARPSTAGPGCRRACAARASRRACRPRARRPCRRPRRRPSAPGPRTVVHSWPAGAIAPASCSGSGRSTSAKGCTASPWAALPVGRVVVRVIPSGSSRSRRDHLEPVGAVRPGDELAERREADVGVVEASTGPEALAHGRARRARPSSPPGVRSHHGPFVSACTPAPCESSWAIVTSPKAEPGTWSSKRSSRSSRPRIAQPHDGDGDEGLGDRAHPVLRVRVGGRPRPARPSSGADGVGPDESAVAHDAGGDRRQPAPALLGREQVVRWRAVESSMAAAVLTRPSLGPACLAWRRAPRQDGTAAPRPRPIGYLDVKISSDLEWSQR